MTAITQQPDPTSELRAREVLAKSVTSVLGSPIRRAIAERDDEACLMISTAIRAMIQLADEQTKPLLDHIDRLTDDNVRLRAEMERRDANETRNCLNWGPCSRHEANMSDKSYARQALTPAASEPV
jgi:hypothetical protein